MKRIFDLLFSFLGLVILSPFLLVIAILIVIDSKGDIFYLQQRVGKDNKDFNVSKFRTISHDSDQRGSTTVRAQDS